LSREFVNSLGIRGPAGGQRQQQDWYSEEGMHRFARILLVIALSATSAVVRAQGSAPQRFENATAGIALTRPAGWNTASVQTVQENRERVQLSDSELQVAMQKFATAPLFVFMKYPEPHPTLNPSVQVILRPLGPLAGSAPTEILKIAVAAMQKGFPDFTFVREIESAQISGLAAAHMRAQYTLKNADGSEFKILSRLWLVPRGSFMFLIGMSGPQEGPDISESEFAEVLGSIKIQK
jgi:hypothetical protein